MGNPLPEMPALSGTDAGGSSSRQSELMDAYNNHIVGNSNDNLSLDDIYKKTSIYKNAELSAKFDLIKTMTLMDDDEVLETIHSYGAGFDRHRENWIFTFLTNEYKFKYPELTDVTSIWEWVCFVILMLVFDGEEALTNLKNSSYTGINVDNANVGRRKRLRIGTSSTTSIVKRVDTRVTHPFENHEYYKNHKMLFSIGRALEYIVPSMFAPLKATHTRAIQKITTGTNDESVPCIRIDVTPGFVVNFNNTVVRNFTFLNYDCPELVEYIESLVDNTLKLKYGLKVGTRKTAGNEKNLKGNDDSKKTGNLTYNVIKSILVFVDSTKETCLGIRSYDDLKVTVGNNVLLNNDEFDAIVDKFNVNETKRYSDELDAFNEEKERRFRKIQPLPKYTAVKSSGEDEDGTDPSNEDPDKESAKRQRVD